MIPYSEYLQVAEDAARIAGQYQKSRFASTLNIEMKGDKNLVTEVDKESERLIVEHLLSCSSRLCRRSWPALPLLKGCR